MQIDAYLPVDVELPGVWGKGEVQRDRSEHFELDMAVLTRLTQLNCDNRKHFEHIYGSIYIHTYIWQCSLQGRALLSGNLDHIRPVSLLLQAGFVPVGESSCLGSA